MPRINFSAESIAELCDLPSSDTEAPLTQSISESELKALAFKPFNLEGFPCHTTACERGVQVTVSADNDVQDASSFNKEAARYRNKNAIKKLWGL